MGAGVVLVGGRSSRMGSAKAAPGQDVGELPAAVETTADPVAGLGPLQGIATGLTAVVGRAPTAFVCATDLPFLHPAFVRRVLRALDHSDAEVALPVVHGFRQPLAAAYRTALAGPLTELIAAGERRLGRLAVHRDVAALDEPALLSDPGLARWDPQLDSVVNVNTAAEYAAARDRPAPQVLVSTGSGAARPVRAATLGAGRGRRRTGAGPLHRCAAQRRPGAR